MQQCVYISTARDAMTEAELTDILNVARAHNRSADITGLLVAGGRRFLQVIEGPEAAVQDLYTRIRRDPRHYAIVTLSDRTIDRREFGDWSMGFHMGGAGQTGTSLRATIEAMIAPITDPNLRAQFQGFADLHVRAA